MDKILSASQEIFELHPRVFYNERLCVEEEWNLEPFEKHLDIAWSLSICMHIWKFYIFLLDFEVIHVPGPFPKSQNRSV